MKEETGYFSSFDGLNLFYRAWEQDTSSRLIVVHGFGEHSGRYQEFAQELSDVPVSVYAPDLRGHGRSEGERVYVESFEQMVDDLGRFRDLIEAKSGSGKGNFILLGQSFGGLIATHTALRAQAPWRALILLSPFFGVPLAHRALNGLASFLNFLSPKSVLNNPIRPIFLTHDSGELERYRRDPLIQRRITFRMAREMFRGSASVWEKASELKLPLLLLASGDDRIVSVKQSRRFFERTRSPEKEMKVFDGCFHELLHERNRKQYMGEIKRFLVRFI